MLGKRNGVDYILRTKKIINSRISIYQTKIFGDNLYSGSEVDQGQKIGKFGNTGKSIGVYLHYEKRDNKGNLIDPRKGNKDLEKAPTTKGSRKNN